jgi:four helix bundle protein
MATINPHGIDERAFDFFCGVIRFVRTIQPEPGVRRLADQMVAAAGSIAANREEATSGSTRKEFIRFNEIALRSAKESVVFLRACEATSLGEPRQCVSLLAEARQLARILGAIVVSSKNGRTRL